MGAGGFADSGLRVGPLTTWVEGRVGAASIQSVNLLAALHKARLHLKPLQVLECSVDLPSLGARGVPPMGRVHVLFSSKVQRSTQLQDRGSAADVQALAGAISPLECRSC